MSENRYTPTKGIIFGNHILHSFLLIKIRKVTPLTMEVNVRLMFKLVANSNTVID